jgi:hypothetical protein
MRNRALRPLDKVSDMKYDKVLFLNDVYFQPIEAAQLLFSTNAGEDGKADYVVACAVDYINPFKFYDTFATRDFEGYGVGVPFYPIFSSAGRAQSRSDILNQKDAVRVRSCWSGMAAINAKYLQSTDPAMPAGFQDIGAHNIDPANPKPVSAPVRFRAEPEMFFDASECCLLVADILRLANPANLAEDSGVYLNPFVRVAYDSTTLWWLPFTRRFERLYRWPHWMVNVLARMPAFNLHRTVEEGDAFDEEVWASDTGLPGNGSWQIRRRRARNGLYCGVREMQVLLQSRREHGKNWEKVRMPPGRSLF